MRWRSLLVLAAGVSSLVILSLFIVVERPDCYRPLLTRATNANAFQDSHSFFFPASRSCCQLAPIPWTVLKSGVMLSHARRGSRNEDRSRAQARTTRDDHAGRSGECHPDHLQRNDGG